MRTMRTFWKTVCWFLLFPPSALAQYPPIAARGPDIQVGVGYSYFNLDVPSSNRVNLSGPTLSISADFRPRFGVTADLGYARATNVFGSGRHSDVLTYLAGPVFHPTRSRHLSTYIHGLLGGARVTGAVPLANGTFLSGYVNKLSWALGGGVEYRVSESFSFRFGADYIHTAYFNSSAVIQGQENLRTGFSIIYSFSGHQTR
jgi:opacity protein-like surface antigen